MWKREEFFACHFVQTPRTISIGMFSLCVWLWQLTIFWPNCQNHLTTLSMQLCPKHFFGLQSSCLFLSHFKQHPTNVFIITSFNAGILSPDLNWSLCKDFMRIVFQLQNSYKNSPHWIRQNSNYQRSLSDGVCFLFIPFWPVFMIVAHVHVQMHCKFPSQHSFAMYTVP